MNPIKKIIGKKITYERIKRDITSKGAERVWICRFNKSHKFNNYEDYADHMQRVEMSQP